MKTKFFFFAMLASVIASAQVTNVTPISANYANKTVSFRVWWSAGTRDATHLSKVWVWVDYIQINSNNTTSGNTWTRATVGTISGGTTAFDGSNRKGFWLEGNASTNYSATLTVQLTNVPAKFNWCAYVSDYPPNATINNGTYTLKGTPPFTINTSITESGKTYSGGCITSLTDKTGCPGIINHSFSAGAINSSSSTVLTNATPAAITSNTNASSGGGFTYRWVRTGTSNATYTDNSAGHSFSTSEVSSAGTWTYYREVRDNTCNTSTWSRSSGSYVLTVIACPYTGSDLYIDATHLCQQRTSGAKNWVAWIKDSRDSKSYRIAQLSTGLWTMDDYLNYTGHSAVLTNEKCTAADPAATAYWRGTLANSVGTLCPNGWRLPNQTEFSLTISEWYTRLQKSFAIAGETCNDGSTRCQSTHMAFVTSDCLGYAYYGNRLTGINPVSGSQRNCYHYTETSKKSYHYSGYARCVRAL